MSTARSRIGPALILVALITAACGRAGTTATDPVGPQRPAATTTATSPTAIPDRSVDLEADLGNLVDETGVPALGAAAFGRDGVTVAAVSGHRSYDGAAPVLIDDPFHLGSNTKAMTAALIGVLGDRDSGISFDTTLGDAFPGLTSMHGDYVTVTLGSLMSHTGGTPAQTPEPDPDFFDLPLREQRAVAAEIILSEPPEVRPGSVSHYSNVGYVVAAAAMEAATSKSWEELMGAELFAPLGMTSCGFGAPGSADAVDAPRGHDHNGEPVHGDNPPVLAPAGGVHCSLADWSTFLTELLNASAGTSHLITADTANRMLSPDAAVPTDKAGVAAAMGWGVLEGPNGSVYIHSGSNGAWFSQAVLVPDRGLGVIGVTNSGPGGELAVSTALDRLTTSYPAVDGGDDQAPAELVSGHYWSDGAETFICSHLAESSPPQCGGTAVPISAELLPDGTPLRRSHGIEWTDDTITIELPTAG